MFRAMPGEDFGPEGLEGVEALVCPTNSRRGALWKLPHGCMIGGYPWLFGEQYPELRQDYYHFCAAGDRGPGDAYVWKVPRPRGRQPRYVIALPLCLQPGDPATLEDVEKALEALHGALERYRIASVAMPALNCNVGGIRFEEDLIPAVTRWMGRHGYYESKKLVIVADPMYSLLSGGAERWARQLMKEAGLQPAFA
jgi:O-acetyl-ADP-ribose deacetylase (regulator of RNase III)